MNWLRDRSIKVKLSAAFGAALVLIVAIGAFSLTQLHILNRSAAEVTQVWLPRVEALGQIKVAMAEHRALASQLIDTTDLGRRAEISTRMDAIAQSLMQQWQDYAAAIDTSEERHLFAQMTTLWQQYRAALSTVSQQTGVSETPAAKDVLGANVVALSDQALSKVEGLIGYSRMRSAAAVTGAQRIFSSALILTSAIIMLSALFVAGAIAWSRQSVSDPIRRVSRAMHRLNIGDASASVDGESERRDEIGALFQAVRGYRESLVHARTLAVTAEQQRQRFVSAIDNMPIGLVMFDKEEKLIVANARYAEIYRLPPELAKPGTPLKTILEHRIRAGRYPGSNPADYVDYLENIVVRDEPFKDLIQFHDGRIISLVYQPMEGGGWVSTHEDVTDRRKAEAKIAHMTHHDALTDLPNRVLLRERIEEALVRASRDGQVAVLCLDLDHFKDINDTLGHTIGDALLQSAAKRLAGCMREDDMVARLGGDEFAIVQVGAEQPLAARALSQRVIEAVTAPYMLDGHEAIIGVSVGIALAPADGRDADHLLKAGDMALYRAKADGRGVYRFFEQEMDARMQERRALEYDLRRAIETEQFELLYQPLFNLASNTVSGFEALLRWHHPERGVIQPAEFVPLAEETGLIVPMGEWILKRACRDAMQWPAPVKVAVNLSPAQFHNAHIMQSVIAALAASGLAANRLELEITELALLADSEATLTTLHRLRALGVRISMDDFGTGYSSLSYLQSFPFDKIKIDRRFIVDVNTDISSLAIIRAVIGLSASLGITTTAEGVETREQFDRVKAEGCTEVQGFLTGRPMALADAVALFKRPGSKATAA